ncbi:MAG TPA: valine--tRNA ligase [Elusimicrobia bacterium]|nr:MAG: valine--tRNA ligase [Elusimicrobia bacterium GWA2_66_18]OGR73011.1 MAG: valine--tRNA ligase [Elusimicrobia bacterium GWC2_65_9]HAZ08155.1 valine--tRNA ligase [Elusimicrobiota bacterium]
MIEKIYDPKPVEEALIRAWEEAKLFRSTPRLGGRPFTVVIPPPNVTGALHVGHALDNALQDAFIRHQRLLGRQACWVPGCDHGGIATQNVMEKQLKAEKTDRHALGREAFLERMQVWTRDCKKTILGQLRRLGCSLDWEREAFTMDEVRAKAVFYAFRTLWEKGLIYRGERLVNWCVRCGTALSDIEVEREERKGALYHIHYRLEGGGEGLVVATTRPETMFGDTAVAVNPKDPRWKPMVGRKVLIPFIDRAVPVIADSYVEFEFGTGALKVTPAHDQNDWEIGQRHDLAALKAIGPDGRLTAQAGPYEGLSREKARDQVVADLEARGYLRKKEDHKSPVGVCYRCHSVIEPLLSLQWFVKQAELALPALKALDDGRFKIHPANWAKPYRDWLVNIKDWCVSRQIWWGHRIPVWYRGDEKPVVSLESPGAGWTQDLDVLDTWFSSALWPLAVFGWPEKTPDFAYYYPTATLVTGYEILHLWVARMQMMGLAFEGKVPFSDAVIHGIVRDKSGKKMSKSLGNVVDPLLMMDKYGTDALRFALLAQAHPGKDIAFDEQSVLSARNFVNKLWNSTRFVLMNLPPRAPDGGYQLGQLPRAELELADRWILSRYQATLAKAKTHLDAYETAAAAEALYAFLWDELCAWHIELAKARLLGPDGARKDAARTILVQVLVGTLKALHPLMPFVTEEIYASLKSYAGESARFVLQGGYHALDCDWSNPEAEKEMALVMAAVTSIRSLRAQLRVPIDMKLAAVAEGPFAGKTLKTHHAYVTLLAGLESLEPFSARPPRSATAVAEGVTFHIPLAGVIDFAKERERLGRELAKAEADIAKIEAKVKNPDFLARAPEGQIAEAKVQHEAARGRRDELRKTLADLS